MPWREKLQEAIDSKATKLDLSNKNIGGEGAIEIARRLKGNTYLEWLDLKDNNIGEEGAKALAEGLKDSKVVELMLNHNDIRDEGAKALANALKDSKIADLYLSSNNIGEEGAKALAEGLKDSKLKKFDLDRNNIGEEGAKALAEGLKDSKVVELMLNHNDIRDEGAKALAEGLKDSQVICLELSHNNMGDEGARALAEGLKDSNVVCLELSHNNIGDEGARALAEGLKDSKVVFCSISYERREIYGISTNIGYKAKNTLNEAIEANRNRISKLIDKFEAICLDDKGEFKDFNKISEDKKLEAIAIIKQCGVRSFGSHLLLLGKECRHKAEYDMENQLHKIENAIKTGIASKPVSVMLDKEIPDANKHIAEFLELKDAARLNATTSKTGVRSAPPSNSVSAILNRGMQGVSNAAEHLRKAASESFRACVTRDKDKNDQGRGGR